MGCVTGCLKFRKRYTGITGTRIEVLGYTLPPESFKSLLYRNGQLLNLDDTEGYTISGNGFDLDVAAEASEEFQVVIFT